MDNEVLSILNKFNCLEHYPKFKDVTMAELRALTPTHLKLRLMTHLPSDIADAITSEIRRNDVKVKIEPPDVKPSVQNTGHLFSSAITDDDEPIIVHEVPGDVTFVSVAIKTEPSVEEATIDDADETMSDSDTSFSEISEEEKFALPKVDFLPRASTLFDIGKAPRVHVNFSGRDMGYYFNTEPQAKRRKVNFGSKPADTPPASAKTRAASATNRAPSPINRAHSADTRPTSATTCAQSADIRPSATNLVKSDTTRAGSADFSKIPSTNPENSDSESSDTDTEIRDPDSELSDTEKETSPFYRFVVKNTSIKWKSLYGACGPDKVELLDCDRWEWGPLELRSPRNLYRLLSQHCQNLTELTFCSNLTLPSTFSGPLTLPNLRVIRVKTFRHLFTFSTILSDIIQAAAGRLETLAFHCGNSDSLEPFMESLRSVLSGPQSGLRGLKSLSLASDDDEPLDLTNEHFKILGSMNCPDLRDLYLDCFVTDNVQAAFETFLRTVPKLRSFTLTGCFCTYAVRPPRVKLVFPLLKSLETLELSRSKIGDSAVDDLLNRPAKRHGLRVLIENEEGQGQEGQGSVYQAFSVTVALPILPSLQQLTLGRYFDLDELHFRSYPSLVKFRVSSPWHLALRSPVSNRSEVPNRTFPNITNLQLPDQLEDDEFVRNVLQLFPNLRNLRVNLPAVKVIRAIAWAVRSVKSLVYLGIVTQFDFESSLETCFVDKPAEVVMSEEEVQKLDTLKRYKYWREYVDYHGIEVPMSATGDLEDLPNSASGELKRVPNCELDDENKYAGLCDLNKDGLNKCFTLYLRHVVRRMRLPTGSLHWNDADCAFGDTLIGFERFPVSPIVEKASEVLNINFKGFENKVYHLPDGAKEEGAGCGRPLYVDLAKDCWAPRRVKPVHE